MNLEAVSNRFVRGVTVQINWRDIEPVQGRPDWSKLDELFAAAASSGKWIHLDIVPGVVSAAGMGAWEDSWLTPLYGALYPERSQWTSPESYPHLKLTGRATVLDFPPEYQDAMSVCPGLHRRGGRNVARNRELKLKTHNDTRCSITNGHGSVLCVRGNHQGNLKHRRHVPRD